MARYYPVCLDLQGKNIMVAGGGDVAERKVTALLRTGAVVSVVSPALNNKLEELKKKEYITHIKDEFKQNYLKNMFVVIGATDNSEVNSFISSEARKKNILVNIVDSPEECTFIVPAIVERGDLLVSVSTSGKSPALARKIRKDLERIYSDDYATFLQIMGEIRSHLMRESASQEARNKMFTHIAANTDEIIQILKQFGKEKARERIQEIAHEQ